MRYLLLIAALLAPLAVSAEQYQLVRIRITDGTGFFVNHDGDIVTNAHVVTNCKSIVVKTITGERYAILRASDAKRDLAVLRVAGDVPAVAPMRWNRDDVNVGDEVTIMGYPGIGGYDGPYQFAKTPVMSLKDPEGTTETLQLGSVAKQGNSGGPVLDGGGNVIGVVVGINYMYLEQPLANGQVAVGDLVGMSDAAITLPVLEDFLSHNGTGYYRSTTSHAQRIPDQQMAQQANRFIVPVRCYL